MTDLTTRHPSTQAIMRHFAHKHLPPHLAVMSARFEVLAHALLDDLPDSAELTAGLRKLLEAKDCAVRALVDTCREPAAEDAGPAMSSGMAGLHMHLTGGTPEFAARYPGGRAASAEAPESGHVRETLEESGTEGA
jgi:hypothetical protein